MPRGPRLDYPGALHHLIACGIERRSIVRSDRDRSALLQDLGAPVLRTGAGLCAWALMPNHFLLLRTGEVPLSRLMQSRLGRYAAAFNRAHRRAGHLFQHRFQSTLVEEDPYLLRLVASIHLNPVRSRLPVTLTSLERYPWTGHAVLLGHRRFPAQDVGVVLGRFGSTVREARRDYRTFVAEAAGTPTTVDLDGGGLRRSADGWELMPALGRGRWAVDERILGRTELVPAGRGNAPSRFGEHSHGLGPGDPFGHEIADAGIQRRQTPLAAQRQRQEVRIGDLPIADELLGGRSTSTV